MQEEQGWLAVGVNRQIRARIELKDEQMVTCNLLPSVQATAMLVYENQEPVPGEQPLQGDRDIPLVNGVGEFTNLIVKVLSSKHSNRRFRLRVDVDLALSDVRTVRTVFSEPLLLKAKPKGSVAN